MTDWLWFNLTHMMRLNNNTFKVKGGEICITTKSTWLAQSSSMYKD